jgi:AcrR family transcriptional regulator
MLGCESRDFHIPTLLLTVISACVKMNRVQIMVTLRRERLKNELREEILAAARDLFVKEGYQSVSMRKISDRVGCASGTIYLHFEDKEAILRAICLETFAKLDKRMEAILWDSDDPLERLRRGGRAYAQFALDHPHHYLLTFGAVGGAPYRSEETRKAGSSSFDCLRNSVRLCIEAGQLRFSDAEVVAQSLWSSLHGLVMLLIAKPGFPFVEQNRLIDSVLDITIEGIRK